MSFLFLKVLTSGDRLLCKDLFIEFPAAEKSNPEGNPLSSCPAPQDSGAEPAHTGIWGFAFILNLGPLARAGFGVLHRGGHKTFKGDFCSSPLPFLGGHQGHCGTGVTLAMTLPGSYRPLALCGGRRRRHSPSAGLTWVKCWDVWCL